MQNEYKGFQLFNDIEDMVMRTRNRAVVMANIAEDHMDRRTKRISPKGASLILNYFNLIPDTERVEARDKFAQNMFDRGFILQA